MQPQQQSYQGMRIKGGLLRARLLFVVLNHGPDVWRRIVAGLSESDRQVIADIAVDDWYPLETLDQIDRLIAKEVGNGDDKVFEQLGEFSATSSLSGPYSSLLNPDVHSFLTQSALIHRAYQDFGTATYEQLSDTSGLLTIKYDPAPPLSFCISGTSYFRHAIELCGARGARVAHTRCCGKGDAQCEFFITWQA
jgi:hypothetical protein